MTGRYVSDHWVWTNDVPFRDGLEYIAERMNQEGYVTGAFGKLHHYPADDPKGFRHVRLMEENRLGEREPYLHWLRQRHPEVESVFNHEGLQFAFPEEEYYEHWIASEAISFIGQTLENPDPPACTAGRQIVPGLGLLPRAAHALRSPAGGQGNVQSRCAATSARASWR